MAPKTERFEMRLDEDVVERVDQWRSEQDGLPSRAEAMRRLVELGLTKKSKKAIQLTDGEKLLTIMLCDVYKHLGISGEVDPEFVAETIYGGHYWAPRWDMDGIFHDHEDHPDDVSLVVNILDMWSFVESGYEALSQADKERVAKDADPFGANPKFVGFDGNNETELMGIARFLIEKMRRFRCFKERELNSHMPSIEGYRRMVNVFEPIRKTLIGHGLSATQIIDILNSRRR